MNSPPYKHGEGAWGERGVITNICMGLRSPIIVDLARDAPKYLVFADTACVVQGRMIPTNCVTLASPNEWEEEATTMSVYNKREGSAGILLQNLTKAYKVSLPYARTYVHYGL